MNGEGGKTQNSICRKTVKIASKFMKRSSSIPSSQVVLTGRSGYKPRGYHHPSAPNWSSSATFDPVYQWSYPNRALSNLDHDVVQIQYARDQAVAREETEAWVKKQRSYTVKPNYGHGHGHGYNDGHGHGHGHGHEEERSVDKLASEYIRKVHERNKYEAAEPTLVCPPPTPRTFSIQIY